MKLNQFADALNAHQKTKENPEIVVHTSREVNLEVLDIIYIEGRIEIIAS